MSKSDGNRILASILTVTLMLALASIPAHGLAQSRATVTVMPQSLRLRINKTATLDLAIDQVSRLYGAQIHLTFDPEALEVIDAQPDQPGVQIKAGAMPIPDLVVRNTVDNQVGAIDYAVTQLPPNQPGEGNGVIASVTVRAKKASLTEIQIQELLLADTDGKSIEVTSAHGQVRVVSNLLWVPFVVGGILLLSLGAGIGFVRQRAGGTAG